MKNSRIVRRVILLSAFVIAVLALPSIASASDRNHDKLPDGWEKRYRLSLKVKQTVKDQDRDGLRNIAEFKAGNNPRKADSDSDGTGDGDENAGTITSFVDGVLTIDLFNGGTITGLVTDETRINCHKSEDESGDETSSARDRGPGSGGPGGEGSENPSGNSGPGPNSGPGGGELPEHPGEHGEPGQCNCSSDALTVGAVVEEAELELSNGDAVFEEIELAESEAPAGQ